MNAGSDRRSPIVSFLTRAPFPVPSVSNYIAISAVILSCAIANVAMTFIEHPEIRSLLKEEVKHALSTTLDERPADYVSSLLIVQVFQHVCSSHALLAASINTYFAFFAMCVKMIIRFAFKALTREEEAMVRHGFFSYLLFTSVFLTVLISANQGPRVLPWLGWFGLIGFMSTLHQITYQRFKFVAPTVGAAGGRLSWLCFFLTVISTLTLLSVIKFRAAFSTSNLMFLFIDALLSLVRSTHGLLRCMSSSSRFDQRPDSVRHFNYYMDLGVSLVTDAIQMCNFAHLMLLSPIGFNLTCIFFFYHMKMTYSSMVMTLARHKKHDQIFQHIRHTYPSKEAEADDLCIVCWERLGESRVLPCAHQFHDWCLMWWLAQDTSCPTCRRPVSSPRGGAAAAAAAIAEDGGVGAGGAGANDVGPIVGNTTVFRFGGPHWFGGMLRMPSMSIEFSHGAAPFLRRMVYDDSQLSNMERQVREMFPQLPVEVIRDDLMRTGNTQATIENILEGRISFAAAGVGAAGLVDDDDNWSINGGGNVVGAGDVVTDSAHSSDSEMASSDDDEDDGDDMSGSRGGRSRAASSRVSTSFADDYAPHDDETDYQRRRREMIAEYRSRYLASDKGRDLRELGYQ